MAYTRVNWQDSPSSATPLNATNLSVMDAALESQDSRTTTMDTQGGASFGSCGRELYVATSGSDAKSGTSWAQAKATIQAAAAALNGQGTVHAGGGSHTGPADLSASHGCRVVGRGIDATVMQASTTTEDAVTIGNRNVVENLTIFGGSLFVGRLLFVTGTSAAVRDVNLYNNDASKIFRGQHGRHRPIYLRR